MVGTSAQRTPAIRKSVRARARKQACAQVGARADMPTRGRACAHVRVRDTHAHVYACVNGEGVLGECWLRTASCILRSHTLCELLLSFSTYKISPVHAHARRHARTHTRTQTRVRAQARTHAQADLLKVDGNGATESDLGAHRSRF